MSDALRVLVVGGDVDLVDEVRVCLEQKDPPVTVQWLRDSAVALARVGGGDIDAVVIDPGSVGGGEHLRGWLDRLRENCPRTQAIVVSESRQWTADLARMMMGNRLETGSLDARPSATGGRRAKLIGFIGAKGGVGTTTVALNTAFVLATTSATILAEIGAGNDTLALRIRTAARSVWPKSAAWSGVWSVKGTPSLRIALAQDIIDPERAIEALETFGEADNLVLDLGLRLIPEVKSVLPRLDALGVVVDMETLSVECARRLLSTIAKTELCPRGSMGVVVVNRASLAYPIGIEELQKVIGLPVMGTIPPAGDLCNAALKARRTVVAFEPESLAGQSMVQVAASFAELTV